MILRCMVSNECSDTSCNTPVIMWNDLAAAVNSTSTIVDLHLDFSWELIEHVEIISHRCDYGRDYSERFLLYLLFYVKVNIDNSLNCAIIYKKDSGGKRNARKGSVYY